MTIAEREITTVYIRYHLTSEHSEAVPCLQLADAEFGPPQPQSVWGEEWGNQYYRGRPGISVIQLTGRATADTRAANKLQILCRHCTVNTCSPAAWCTSAQWTLSRLRRTELDVIWLENITGVKMMSMKLPSNEEIKKWNVDQVQEFLAQVDIENHLFTKHVCQTNSITNLNNFLNVWMTTPTDMYESESCETLERLKIPCLAWQEETVIYDDNK